MSCDSRHRSDHCLIDKETAILSLIRKRDESGLLQLIELYGTRVKGLCLRILSDTLEAESVASDVFLEIWNRPDCYIQSRGSLRTYIMTIARSRSIDRVRSFSARAKNHEKFCQTSSAGFSLIMHTPPADLLDNERSTQITQAVEELPPNQQKALRLAFFSGMSHRQVADELGMPLGTVKTHIRKGLLRLRATLAQRFEIGDAT